MIRVKSESNEGIYYLVNGWEKNKAFWVKDGNKPCTRFKELRTAKMCLTKLMKIMPDYLDDIITFEEI